MRKERKMAGSLENKIFKAADPIAEELGFYVVDAEYKKEGDNKVLRVYIDKKGGIGIDECEIFSRRFEEEFDKLDAINEAYTLEISSPGVDRVLKTEREFNYYIGREVEIKMYKAVEEKKEFTGILKNYSDKMATIIVDGKDITINVSEAVYIRLYFKI